VTVIPIKVGQYILTLSVLMLKDSCICRNFLIFVKYVIIKLKKFRLLKF